MTTPRELFEILEVLVKNYGYDDVKTTVDSIMEMLKKS